MKGLFFLVVTIMLTAVVTSIDFAQAEGQYISYPTRITWSPNGLFIGVSGYSLMQVIDVTNGNVVLDVPVGDQDTFGHDWSADSQRLAVVYHNSLHIWDVSAQSLLFVSDSDIGMFGTFRDLDWSSDGDRIVTAHRSGSLSHQVLVWDSNTYEILQVISPVAAAYIKLHPDNQFLAVYNTVGPYIYKLNAPNDPPISFEGRPAIAFAWSRNGDQLIVGHGSGQVVVWDFRSQSQVASFSTGVDEDFAGLSWSPDNALVALVTSRLGISVWDVQTGGLLYETDSVTSFAVDFSPYGGRIAFPSLVPPSIPIERPMTTQVDATLLANGLIQVVVPDASLNRLNIIAQNCIAPEFGLMEPANEARLPDFVAQVEALPEDAIPPACRADLLAVAEAIIAQQ